jgi:quercetin 2,3-dioxygenase
VTADVRRAGDRFVTTQPGIISYHSFSAGPHYDPRNLRFGLLVGFDEHHIEPGTGFAMHAHRGVDVVSWVLEGALTHEDSLGNKQIVIQGRFAYLVAGSGVRHEERNEGRVPLRLVQATLLAEPGPPAYVLTDKPAHTGAMVMRTLRPGGEEISLGESQLMHLFVGSGDVTIAGLEPLGLGDALRAAGPEVLTVSSGAGAQVLLFEINEA